jgi:hypothetical protein
VFTKVSVTSFRLLKHIGAKCATTTKAQKTIKKKIPTQMRAVVTLLLMAVMRTEPPKTFFSLF